MNVTSWKYYLPKRGETPGDAIEIQPGRTGIISGAEDAAGLAARHEFHHRGGWEDGVLGAPQIVIISPDEEETCFAVERESIIIHHVTEME